MPITRRRLLAMTAASAAATSLPYQFAGAQTAATPVASPVANPDIDALVQAGLETAGGAGAAYYLAMPDQPPVAGGVGLADLGSQSSMTADHHLRIGSISKSFTATRFLMLVDAGAVTLEDTLANVLPAYDWIPNAAEITMRQMLNMRSGIMESTATTGFAESRMADPFAHVTVAEAIEWIRDSEPMFAPGTSFTYCNTNYQLLDEAIAALTGVPTAQAVTDDILTPLGLANTVFPVDSAMPEPFARGYVYPEGVSVRESMAAEITGTPMATPVASPVASPASTEPIDVTEFSPTLAGGAGAMISTVGDLALWNAALHAGTLLSEESRTAMFDFQEADQGFAYGMGVFNAMGMVGHNGEIDGYQSMMAMEPESGMVITLLANAGPPKSGHDVPSAILESIFSGM